MRYPDSGGLTARERAAREQVRFEAAGMFEQDADPVQIARELRGEHQVGVCVAAGVAGWWPGRFGVEGAGRGEVPSVAGAAGPAARGAGGRPGRAWVGRPAVDTGAGRRADRPVVQGAVLVAGTSTSITWPRSSRPGWGPSSTARGCSRGSSPRPASPSTPNRH